MTEHTPQHQAGSSGAIDVHQHLWPDELVDRLRARSKAPYLRGWTLYTEGEPPYDVDPAGHDVATRIAAGSSPRMRSFSKKRNRCRIADSRRATLDDLKPRASRSPR